MNITILSIGTRGDVQPFLALGLELQRSGHDLKIVTHATNELGLEVLVLFSYSNKYLISVAKNLPI
ncbi:MAG: glycosyltransferase [Xenococcaceae cyanobacterium]